MPKIALRGRENLKLTGDPFAREKISAVDIGLLRLSDSAANSAVAAFTNLAKATVPKMIKNRQLYVGDVGPCHSARVRD